MPYLVAAGITLPIRTDAGGVQEREWLGESVRMFDNSLRSTRQSGKRAWERQTAWLSAADFAALEAALLGSADGVGIVTCSGDMLGGSVVCEVTIAGVAVKKVTPGVQQFAPTLRIREV